MKLIMQLKKCLLKFSVLSFFVFLLPGCWSMQDIVQDDKLILINVLDKDLYDDCHIKGSINIPFEDVEGYLQHKKGDDVELIFYCSNRRCTASHSAAKKAIELGFSDVLVYVEGTAGWYQAGLPVVGNCKKNYLKKRIEKHLFKDDEIVEIFTDDLAKKMNFVSSNN
jgi:rhodanese-related sulfurtransferase